MKSAALLDRAVHTVLCTMLLAGGGGLVLLLAHLQVPDWWLPASVLLAAFVPRRVAWPTNAQPAPRWLLAVGLAVVLLLAVALAYGATATASRHWDGAAMWDVKAWWLTQAPTLQQPFFRDLGVYCHGRDYPLLQPLLVATTERVFGGGRSWFVVAFALAGAVVGLSTWRLTARGGAAWLAALAFVVTPNLVNPTSGGFDSGYADGMAGALLTVAVAGALVGDVRWLVLGTALGVVCKPEGLLYGGAVVAALWLAGSSGLLRWALVGWLLGALVQLPLQRDLLTAGASRDLPQILAVLSAVGAVVLGSDVWLQRRRANPRTRLAVGAVAGSLAIAGAAWLLAGPGEHGSSFGGYLAEPARLVTGLAQLPAIGWGILQHGVLRGAFGLCWVLAPIAWWLLRRGERDAVVHTARALPVLLLAIWIAPFVLSPFADLQHHLRSTLPRVLVHGCGAACLLVAVAWARAAGPSPQLPRS